ncbi:MAG TPA: hypothetical protein VFC68_05660, partial [Treponemataceae bacterium]|nr:hypothetical protein [Treponemataceae bacterium]
NNSGITQYFNGDYENFNDQGGSEKTVNFICAHDGFTLADLVSYTGVGNAQNEQLLWPFGPSDGGNGDQNTPAKTEKVWRRQAIRNFATLQMFSRGVPMIVYGDEFGRTQNGNNNPYNIDSVCTWNNYNMINTDTPQTASTDFLAAEYHNNLGTYSNIDNKNGNFVFFQYLMNLRKTEPGLTQPGYDVQIDYKHEDGTSELVTDARCIWMKINGSSVSNGNDYLVFSNMWQDEVAFTVPTAHTGKKWVRIVDTAKWAESNYNCWDDENAITIENTYGVNAWSIVVLKQIIE